MNQKAAALFVGHGSPTNVIEENVYSQTWEKIGKEISPLPKAIVVFSAHWETNGTRITAMENPRTIYDFYGFPAEMYELKYPAKGDPKLALKIKELLKDQNADLDYDWGLDHGAWSILKKMFPEANIPVIQISLDRRLNLQQHYALGKSLAPLRNQNILFLGSGDIVHNLREVVWKDIALEWAKEFDELVIQKIKTKDHLSLMDLSLLGEHAKRAIPTLDHWIPLMYILGMQEESDSVHFFNENITLGAISMTSFILK
jgi:4,5-DOPA dioxygenase extradiol